MGTQIAKTLLEEGHSVAIIEANPKRYEAIESLDVLAVEGNAASPAKLREAGISSADLLLAVTGSDEVNIISCVIGKSKGCKTVARISSEDYMRQGAVTGRLDIFSIDMAVSPNMVTAKQITEMLTLPSMVESGNLSNGRAIIIEIRLENGSSAIGRKEASLGIPKGAIIGSVSRAGRNIHPDHVGKFQVEDRIIMILNSKELVKYVESSFGVDKSTNIGQDSAGTMEKVVIVGATPMGVEIARALEHEKVVMMIDPNEGSCSLATENLGTTLVICGDATDNGLFYDEGIQDAGALVAVTENAEYNMLCCLLAKKWGVGKTLAIVDDTEMRQLFEEVGVDIALSPRMMTVNTIIQSISGKGVSSTLNTMQGSGSQIMEVHIKESLWMVGKEYGHLKFPKETYVGAVIRDSKVIVPTSYDIVRAGDSMIIFLGPDTLKKVEKMFSHHNKRGLF